MLLCHCDAIYFENKKRFSLESEPGGRGCGEGSSSSRAQQIDTADITHVITHVVSVPYLETSKIVHLGVVGIGLEMRLYRDIRGALTFYFITYVLNKK